MGHVRSLAVLGGVMLVSAAHAQTAGQAGPAAAPTRATRGVRILEPTEPAEGPANAPTPAVVAAPVRPLASPVVKSCARPFAQPDLTLADPAAFDRALAAKLRSHGHVVVDLAHPYPQGDPAPAPLSTWLAEVDAAHGKVTLQPYCTRSAFGDWVSSFFHRDPHRLYRPVRGYDVVLHADGLDQVVTQVEFVPQAAS